MSSIDAMKDDIQKINNFATDFFTKTGNIEESVKETLEKLDKISQIEKQNQLFLNDLCSKLEDPDLDNLMENLQLFQEKVTTKQKDYLTTIETNSQSIHKIKGLIETKKDKIAKIFEKIDNLEKSVQLIKTDA